ncbi:hypothetical protein FRC04_001216 [Tulasnella sp. 424]|nr:hypothetical protein FRC04_001216 [Tulasnella sp. 424]KAG8969586.1 hypothetical protein FRC05_001017 [Tulasnella sp. 425]
MHHLSLSSSPIYAPGPVTYVSTSSLVAPRPVPSSPPLIGCGWPAPFQPPQAPIPTNAFPSEPPAQVAPAFPPRPPMQAKIPPEKGRKSFPCLHPGCGMKFPKRNALVQHMRSHTGERPEVCDWCSRAFSLKCNLRRHYRTCKKKKALEATAMAAKKEPSSSPPPSFEQSPSPGASSPSTTVVPTSHDSPPANMFAPPPDLWAPGFSFTPSHQASSTLVADMDCHTLFPAQFVTACPYTTLIQAQF